MLCLLLLIMSGLLMWTSVSALLASPARHQSLTLACRLRRMLLLQSVCSEAINARDAQASSSSSPSSSPSEAASVVNMLAGEPYKGPESLDEDMLVVYEKVDQGLKVMVGPSKAAQGLGQCFNETITAYSSRLTTPTSFIFRR